MAASIDTTGKRKRILLLASNPSVSETTGWPIGFWWAELTHPYWEFIEAGYEVTIASPDGGMIQGDSFSDPADESGYSTDDLISRGFINSDAHRALTLETPSLAELEISDYDALFLVGGQAPMYTFRSDQRVKRLAGQVMDEGRILAVVCHATCILLDATTPDGELIVRNRTWTGFANSEEAFADEIVGQRIQPFWIEEEAAKIADTNFIVQGPFRPHAVRDGNLITGQQQYSGSTAARLVIEALGR